jgi:hypothetical protein
LELLKTGHKDLRSFGIGEGLLVASGQILQLDEIGSRLSARVFWKKGY